MGEDVTDMATTTSQLQAKLLALTGGQVDIMADANTFKNSTQILREMAEAWEDMTDIQRASALELMGGKRQANVLSALIQNFDTVEKAIETSANSAGSALKENERYLDSIQGKIDQFNNAMQAMWSNTLDSDVVKGFVNLGTEIIKVIDKIGLLNSALLAFGAYKGIGKLFNLFKNSAVPIKTTWQYINELTVGFKGFTVAQIKANTATAAGHLINSQYSAGLIRTNLVQWLTQKSTEALEAAKYQLKLAEMGLMNGVATTADVQAAQAAVQAASIPVDYAKMTTTQLLSAGFTQLAASVWGATKAIAAFLFTNPVGWVILAIGAIAGGVAIFNAFTVSAEEASEQLEETKNKISDLESELESLQTELDEAREKIAELTALPYLSLTQQEDLDRLEREVELLERQIALKERQLAIEEANLVEDAELAVKKNWGSTDKNKKDKKKLNKYIEEYNETAYYIKKAEDALLNWDDNQYTNIPADVATNMNVGIYGSKEDLIQAIRDAEADNAKVAASIEEIFNDPIYAGLEYGMSDEIDAFLDDFNNAQLKWEKALYGDNSTVSIIESLWGPNASEEMKAVKSEIDKIMAEDGNWASDDEKWQSKNEAIKKYIESLDETADGYHQLDYVVNELGTTAQDISDYFTVLNGEFNSNTIEGIAQQYAKAEEVMGALKDTSNGTFTLEGQSYNWDEFFSQDDQGKFKARVDRFAEILKGMDNDTRETFVNIVESAVNAAGDISKIDWDQAIAKLNFSGLDRTFELLNNEFEGLNNEMFAGAADDINGLIDTVSELQAALEDVASTMDLVHTAQTQMNGSGRISTKTALELMQTTEDWESILEITNGTIKLRDGAEQHLIQTELTAIKTQLHYAWTTAQARYETALAAQGELDYANNSGVVMTAESIKAEAIGRVSAVVVALGAAMDKLMAGEWGSVFSTFGDTYKTATATVVQDAQQYTTDLATLQQNADNAKKIYDTFSSVDTTQEFKDNYDFNETPGDKYGEDDKSKTEEALDAFQKEMEYWENRIGANQSRYEQLQNEIDLLEAKGQKADASYYQEQIALEKEREELLLGQKQAAEDYLEMLEFAGKEGSEEWWEVANTLNDIEGELDDVTASIVDLQDAIGEIDVYKFEEFNTRLDDITSKLGTIRDLIAPDGEEDWFNDQGEWTEDGVAVLGTYVQELETYKNGLAETTEELDKYNAAYSDSTKSYYESLGIHSEQEYYDKVQELTEQQYDYAQSISDTEQSVVDMYESNIDAVEEYTETLIDSYNDYIDSVKEALDAERDLFDFKKNVQKQSKDIAAIERRIASLSGSTNASDVAERRKLEAELYESRESLNDTYYDHARSAQDEALDAERTAYEETMTKFVEGLRIGLESATANMDEFLMSVTSMVTLNADTVLAKYQETELPLGDAITNPWEAAKKAVGNYSGDALELMNTWAQNGFLTTFPEIVKKGLKSPWEAGQSAVGAFKTSVDTVMGNVVKTIESNVKTASSKLSELYKQIITTENRAADLGSGAGDDGSGGDGAGGDYTGGGGGGGETDAQKKEDARKAAQDYVNKKGFSEGDKARWGQDKNFLPLLQALIGAGGSINDLKGKVYKNSGKISGYSVSGLSKLSWGADDFSIAIGGVKYNVQRNSAAATGDLGAQLRSSYGSSPSDGQLVMHNNALYVSLGKLWYSLKDTKDKSRATMAYYNKLNAYAKGTTGTPRDEWALTDEPKFGDELVLVPGKDGNLSFMRKGTGVVPADLTANLMEWGQFTPDSMNLGSGVNVNMINNAVNKPEFNFAFDALVKAENITEETLPAVKKLVTQELNRFTKELNYALKGKGAR